MKKQKAIEIFKTSKALAKAINVTPQAVSKWPEDLSSRLSDRVIAAAIRQGKEVPKEWLNKQ